MDTFSLLTVTGRDRPGIVARVTGILFESGCNIADSSMTRLGGAFTVMLILRTPDHPDLAALDGQFQALAREMDLAVHLRTLPADDALRFSAPAPENTCIISVLGADQPGIVFRVAQTLAAAGGNVIDLYTRVIGTERRPVYSMVIEAELADGFGPLEDRLAELARSLNVDISVRPSESAPL